jgi:hypothetical protein
MPVELTVLERWPENLLAEIQDLPLFNTKEYLSQREVIPLICLNNEGKEVGFWYMESKDQSALTPSKAPFSEPVILPEYEADVLNAFMRYMEKKVKNLYVLHSPSFYPNSSRLYKLYLDFGFSATEHQVSHYIKVDNRPFLDIIKANQRRRLKRLKVEKMYVELVRDISLFYKNLKSWRGERGHSISVSLEELKKQKEISPDHFHFLVVKKKEAILAQLCYIKVMPGMFFYFLPASDPNFDRFSPMLLLLEFLYQEANRQGVKTIDLGTSMLDGKPNQGLIRFKESVGGLPAVKYSLQYSFH